MPAHMQYPGIWELGETGPQGVADYLNWILTDEERLQSAAGYLRFLKIGMHFLTVAQEFNEQGEVIDKLELNFWSEKYPSERGSGGHAHARSPILNSFIHPDSRQIVTGISLLPPGARQEPGMHTREQQLSMLAKVDDGRGVGTQYHPITLGERLVDEVTFTLPPLTRQEFDSTFIHEVQFQGKGTGVTVQRQGPTEQAALNTFEGFIHYKGLTPEEAERVVAHRNEVLAKLDNPKARLVSSTVLVRALDFDASQMEDGPIIPPQERFEELATGSLKSLKLLGAQTHRRSTRPIAVRSTNKKKSPAGLQELGFSATNELRGTGLDYTDHAGMILYAIEKSGILPSVVAELPHREDSRWDVSGQEVIFPLGTHHSFPLEASLRVFTPNPYMDTEEIATSADAPDWSVRKNRYTDTNYAITDIGYQTYESERLNAVDANELAAKGLYNVFYSFDIRAVPQLHRPADLARYVRLIPPSKPTFPVDLATDIGITYPNEFHRYFAPGSGYAAMLSLTPSLKDYRQVSYLARTMAAPDFFEIPVSREDREELTESLLETIKYAEEMAPGEWLTLEELPEEIQQDLDKARTVARTQAVPEDKTTIVGCVISGEGEGEKYLGANIKRDYGIHTTHAEELAANNILMDKVPPTRLALYTEVGGKMSSRPTLPCGNCREILMHALRHNGQKDLDIYAMSSDETVRKIPLSKLLPLAGM